MSLQKNYFLSFHSLIFHSNVHKHPACKMERDEQEGASRKLEVLSEHVFLNDSKIPFAATKINILIFSLAHSLISLMGLSHFPQWKRFFSNSLINS